MKRTITIEQLKSHNEHVEQFIEMHMYECDSDLRVQFECHSLHVSQSHVEYDDDEIETLLCMCDVLARSYENMSQYITVDAIDYDTAVCVIVDAINTINHTT